MKKILRLAGCASFLFFAFVCPVRAQYYPYFSSASALLWPLTAASYQLFGGSGYALGNMFMRGSYAPYGYTPYGGSYGSNYYGYPQNQQNPGPFSGQYPSNAYSYGNSSQPVYGQTYAGQMPQGQNQYQQGPNSYNNPAINSGNNQINNPDNNQANHSSNNPLSANRSATNPVINPATGQRSNYGSTSSYADSNMPSTNNAIAAAPARFDQKGPTPAVFIKFVVEKYNGDLYRALRDRELYSWAESLNLVSANGGYNHLLSPNKSRRDTVAKVLKDNTINPAYKIEILQILMRP